MPTAKRATAKPKSTRKDLTDWRDDALVRLRKLIKEADPAITEEVKWRKPSNPGGVAAFSKDGMIGTGETYKDKVKFTFAKGAALEDPAGLFNAADNGKVRRAIDIREGDKVDERAFKALVREAVKLNGAGKNK